jgi:TolA-binding protein/uncharacterized protein (UPF0147 family)
MAKKICFALASLSIFIILTSPVAAQSDLCAGNPNGLKIVLPSGDVLDSNVIEAVVDVNGKQQAVQLTISCIPVDSASAAAATQGTVVAATTGTQGSGVATATGSSISEAAATLAPSVSPAATPEAESSPESSSNLIALIAAAALIPVIVIGLGVLVYLKVIRPRTQRKPYAQALENLKNNRFDEALPALTSIEGQLSESDRRDARFFIAYSNYEQNNIDQAIYLLNVLYRENGNDEAVAYFLAYLHIKQKQYDKAEPILDKLEKAGKLEIYQVRKLLGLVKLYQGMKAFNEGRIEVAVELFEKVKALGDYADQIPSDVSNRHIVLGTKALYEHDLDEARHHFESLQNAAAKASPEEQTALKGVALLGMAMVAWLNDAVDYDDVEKQLVGTAQWLAPEADLTRPWPQEGVTLKPLQEKLADPKDPPSPLGDAELVLRDIHFLRGINLLKQWNTLDRKNANQVNDQMLNKVLERLACALNYDDDFSDVLLIVGLLFYYLYEPGLKRRGEGIRYLEEARKQGMRVPEALEILNRIDRHRRANAGAVEQYLLLVDKYVHDQTVPKELRLAVLERLSYHQKVQGWATSPDVLQARHVEPTVAEVRRRSETLRVHIEELLMTRAKSKEMEKVRQLSQQLNTGGEELLKQAEKLRETEAELLAQTGNQLLQD